MAWLTRWAQQERNGLFGNRAVVLLDSKEDSENSTVNEACSVFTTLLGAGQIHNLSLIICVFRFGAKANNIVNIFLTQAIWLKSSYCTFMNAGICL